MPAQELHASAQRAPTLRGAVQQPGLGGREHGRPGAAPGVPAAAAGGGVRPAAAVPAARGRPLLRHHQGPAGRPARLSGGPAERGPVLAVAEHAGAGQLEEVHGQGRADERLLGQQLGGRCHAGSVPANCQSPDASFQSAATTTTTTNDSGYGDTAC